MQWITFDSVHPHTAGFANGAELYGREIVAHQKAHWDALDGDYLLSVCLPMPKLKTPLQPYGTLIQYLHTYPYKRVFGDVDTITRWAKKPVIFLTAYTAFRDLLREAGYQAVYIPMSIERFTHSASHEHQKRIVWFGHQYSDKGIMLKELRGRLAAHGYALDVVSKNTFNGKPVTRKQALDIVGRYRYGIGVGRCAQEMFHMGMRVLIAGANFGGLVMTVQDEAAQMATNYNGRIITHSRSIDDCIEALPQSRIATPNYVQDMNHAAIFEASLAGIRNFWRIPTL